MFEYVKGLIAMRKAHPAFRMGDADMVRRQLEFLPVENTNVVAFILKDNAMVTHGKYHRGFEQPCRACQAGHSVG